MVRSRRATAPPSGSPPTGVGHAPTPSLASAILPRVWQGLGYRPLPDVAAARPLFDFAAMSWPAPDAIAFGWGAFTGGDRLVGALVAEVAERVAMIHGPVVTIEEDPVEVAAQLVAAALDHSVALALETVCTRPSGLDRVWVKHSTDQLHNLAVQGPASRDLLASIIWTPQTQPRILMLKCTRPRCLCKFLKHQC